MVATMLVVTPPFLLFAKIGQLVLLSVTLWMLWLRELPAMEDRAPGYKWRFRASAVVLGVTILVLVVIVGSKVFSRWPVADDK